MLHPAPLARAEDAAREFTAFTNASGAAWTYGWTPTLLGAFTLFVDRGTDAVGQYYWNHPSSQTAVYYNPSNSSVSPTADLTIPAHTMTLLPGTAWQYSVVRWTAGFAATYQVRARFTARSTAWTQIEIAVVSGGNVVYSAWINPYFVGNTVSMSALLPLAEGDTVDFLVGPSTDSSFTDWMGLDATILPEPPAAGPAGPVFTFGGDRFVPCRWPGDAFESIAYDPLQDHIASRGEIADRCGDFVSAGPDEAPGLAWDAVTQTYWQITADRIVKRWDGDTVVETVFTIPLTFTVPVSGLDTLESVRGIAVDESFVYVVDAGPDPGQITSNAWFKFTRDGTPVKSSKSTDLHDHLDMDPDALVDDIVYVPPTCPFLPGRLLVALEHSGIQVLDTEGNHVDKFLWSTQGLTPARGNKLDGKINAFAGLTIDPATGNLYLVDNDTGNCQVWTRIAEPGATSYVLGTGGPTAVLEYPNPGCNLALWGAIATGPDAPSNFFAHAYRETNHALYTCEYGSGELWRYDARTGTGARIGHTGGGDIWGVTFDTERDVLYGLMQGGGGRIAVIDPVTASMSALPEAFSYFLTDVAFSPDDNSLYGIDQSLSPAQLIRIDRDTGAAVQVGETVSSRGLDYEPATGKLLALTNGALYEIEPSTGAYALRATLPTPAAPDGVGVVPIPANPSVVAAPPAAVDLETDPVQIWPNPSNAGTRIQFTLAQDAAVKVGVYDVRGRLVRLLQPPTKTSATMPHVLDWDGRDAWQREVSSGVYFVRVDAGTRTAVGKILRVR